MQDNKIDVPWTEERGKCGFCNGEEQGYAKQDAKGVWKPACWDCVNPDKKDKESKKK